MQSPASTVPPGLHALESELMQLIWERGECTVRTVLEELNKRSDRQRKYTTVMTTMARLDRKGLLIRRRCGRTDIYMPAMTNDAYLEARAAAEVGALVDNYGDAALMHFARQMDKLDPQRREELRRLARRD